jgi:hypothetical protein
MKITAKLLIAGLLFMFFLPVAIGQRNINDDKLMKARLLLNDYRDASFFRDMSTGGYDPSWEGIFRNCFVDNAKIVMDVPFRKQQPEPDAEKQTFFKYLEVLSIDDYIETVKSGYHAHKITDFSFSFSETGFDTTGLTKNGALQFEISKTFSNTGWSVSEMRNYIVEIKFVDEKPKITAIRLVDENIARSNVNLTFINSSLNRNDPGYFLTEMVSHINIEFDESVSNRKLIVKTDQSGKIDLGMIPNRASIKIDTVIDNYGYRFSIPADWSLAGKKVNTQPAQGFLVSLQPWKWNGFSWSVRGFGGMISHSANQLSNFSPESNFENEPGFKYGFGLELVKLFSLRQVLNQFGNWFATDDPNKLAYRRNFFVGAGMGISYYQYQYKISGEGFNQNPYNYLDRLGTSVQVLVSGKNYQETTASNGVVLPIFAEFRKVYPNKKQYLQALSLQAGINLVIPFETDYDISGTFSRHGLYEQFNPQPITNDPFYNYYTNSPKTIDQNFEQNLISPSLMFKFSGYFDILGQRSDNLLDVGLLLSFPVDILKSDDGFYLATGNDEFSSISNSKNKIYNYFIGLSVGYNFINYRLY